MLSSKYILFKTKLSKWLLTATLFLSIFSFSGYVAQNQFRQQEIKQTELFVSLSTKINRFTLSFKKALSNYFSKTNSISFNSFSILQYNRLTKIKIEHLSKQSFHVFCSRKYFQNKMIPQSQDEDYLNSLKG